MERKTRDGISRIPALGGKNWEVGDESENWELGEISGKCAIGANSERRA